MTDDKPASYDDLLDEVRRAGRAAVAARAAAEACEETVERLEHQGKTDDADDAPVKPRALIEALLPVCDALGRMAFAARARGPVGLFERLRTGSKTAAELQALREAIVMLDAQLTSALEGCGVRADRQVGDLIDPERHRVVETRPRQDGELPGAVADIVRPGYSLGAARIRDADVVATR